MEKIAALKVPPSNEVMSDNKLRWYTPKPERDMDVAGLRVIEPINDHLAAAFDYRNYHLLKNPSCYNDDVEHELHKLTKRMAVKIKDRTFYGKDRM